MAGVTQNSLSPLGIDPEFELRPVGVVAEERCSPRPCRVRLEHSGHSGSLTGQLEAHFLPAVPAFLVPIAPLLPYPIPTPCGTSPTSQEPTGKDEGNEIRDVMVSHLPICSHTYP